MTTGNRYIPVIGLEVHLRLETNAKMFAPEPNSYNESPNSRTSEITIAEPGALPGINAKALENALSIALAFNSRIAPRLVFDRKNSFYPDLPKGYQITQYRHPLGSGGSILFGSDKKISLKSIQLEEDSAKTNKLSDEYIEMDFNRAGIPLGEIVTTLTIHSGETATAVVREITRTARYLGISRAHPEEGSLRCDTNISLQNVSSGKNGNRIEIKNLNSLAHIQQTLDYESRRRQQVLEEGKEILPETRTFDPVERHTIPMPSKEASEAYRYTQEFDLSPVTLSQDYIDLLKAELPKLPWEKKQRISDKYNLPPEKANFLADNHHWAMFFECLAGETDSQIAWAWLAKPVQQLLNQKNDTFREIPFNVNKLAELIHYVQSGKVSRENAEQFILPELMVSDHLDIKQFISNRHLGADSDSEKLEQTITSVLQEHREELERLKNGEKKLTGFFIGQILKKNQAKTDPRIIRKRLLEALNMEKRDDK